MSAPAGPGGPVADLGWEQLADCWRCGGSAASRSHRAGLGADHPLGRWRPRSRRRPCSPSGGRSAGSPGRRRCPSSPLRRSRPSPRMRRRTPARRWPAPMAAEPARRHGEPDGVRRRAVLRRRPGAGGPRCATARGPERALDATPGWPGPRTGSGAGPGRPRMSLHEMIGPCWPAGPSCSARTSTPVILGRLRCELSGTERVTVWLTNHRTAQPDARPPGRSRRFAAGRGARGGRRPASGWAWTRSRELRGAPPDREARGGVRERPAPGHLGRRGAISPRSRTAGARCRWAGRWQTSDCTCSPRPSRRARCGWPAGSTSAAWRGPGRGRRRPGSGSRTRRGSAARYRAVRRLLPEGVIEVAGEEESRITVHGRPLNLRDTETALAAHPAVRDAVVRAGQRLAPSRWPSCASAPG